MSTAASFINSNQYKRVLLIGADKMSSIVDFTDRTTCIIFGDGAGAVLFEPSTNDYGFENAFHGNDGKGRNYLNIHDGGSLHPINEHSYSAGKHYVRQEGRAVFKYAVKHMSETSNQLIAKNKLSPEKIDYVITHQANKRIIDATTNHLGVAKEKVLTNIHKYGNTTAATLPLLLADFESSFKMGDKLLFTAFGGGFTWGAAYLTWNYDYKN
jgi:3-oxoacyl-[acyl-carrier-protein] synthase-3